jgi:hypothetical protein
MTSRTYVRRLLTDDRALYLRDAQEAHCSTANEHGWTAAQHGKHAPSIPARESTDGAVGISSSNAYGSLADDENVST